MPRRLLAELMGLRFLIRSKIVAFSAMAILSATFALPVNVYATSLGEASGNIGFVDNSANQISPRMMYEDVLDTYAYYICYSDSSIMTHCCIRHIVNSLFQIAIRESILMSAL